ncbi:MAG TPA: hypothetical protein VGD67_19415 [Pseudonocardiaceae bacterium]
MGSRDRNPEWERLNTALPAFDDSLRSHDANYQFRQWIYTGRSGSLVGVVLRHEPPMPPQQLIMRISAEDLDPDEAAEEARRIRRSWDGSGDKFRKAHLAPMAGDAIRLAGRQLTFQRIAGGDLTSWRPLADRVESDTFAGTCANVTASIVDDWNPDHLHTPQMRTPTQFLRELLGDRLEPGSKLLQWASRAGISPATPWVTDSRDSRQLRNPLMLATDEALAGARRLPIIRGRAHGDLNLHNILLPDKWKRYQLVDLGEFDTAAPLARDPMHLLLSVTAKWIATVDRRLVGRDLAEAVVPITHYRPPARVSRFATVSRKLHNALQEWARTNGHGDAWAEQSLLALIAAALRFAGREVPDTDAEAARKWFFYLAAVATSDFLQRWPGGQDLASSPTNVVPIRPRPGGPAPIPMATAKARDEVTAFLRDLANELSRRTPDPGTASSMVFSTYAVRQLLQAMPTTWPADHADAMELAGDLRRAMNAAVQPGARHSHRDHAVTIHEWLRDLLADRSR